MAWVDEIALQHFPLCLFISSGFGFPWHAQPATISPCICRRQRPERHRRFPGYVSIVCLSYCVALIWMSCLTVMLKSKVRLGSCGEVWLICFVCAQFVCESNTTVTCI